MGKRILVITGGEFGATVSSAAPDRPYDLVIAADSGLDKARALGIKPDVVIGDLDSASPDVLDEARREGTLIDAHPAEKDHTDFELALQLAIREEAAEITVIGGGGGRPDHWLANLGLIAATARAGVNVAADMGGWSVSPVVPDEPYAEDHGPGQLVSLIPFGGDARGVVTKGLAYPLCDEDLMSGSSRGVSNVASGGTVRIELKAGALLVMRPHGPTAEAEEGGRS